MVIYHPPAQDPTPDEIAERAAVIRSAWSERELLQRSGYTYKAAEDRVHSRSICFLNVFDTTQIELSEELMV